MRHQTFQTLRDLLLLAQRRPLVLVLEDLHWADPLSLDLTGHLLEMVENTPLLLLCLYRPGCAGAGPFGGRRRGGSVPPPSRKFACAS